MQSRIAAPIGSATGSSTPSRCKWPARTARRTPARAESGISPDQKRVHAALLSASSMTFSDGKPAKLQADGAPSSSGAAPLARRVAAASANIPHPGAVIKPRHRFLRLVSKHDLHEVFRLKGAVCAAPWPSWRASRGRRARAGQARGSSIRTAMSARRAGGGERRNSAWGTRAPHRSAPERAPPPAPSTAAGARKATCPFFRRRRPFMRSARSATCRR